MFLWASSLGLTLCAVVRKLNAAKDGGYIFQSDHSMSSNVDPETYDCVMQLMHQFGNYPLQLGQYDDPIICESGADP